MQRNSRRQGASVVFTDVPDGALDRFRQRASADENGGDAGYCDNSNDNSGRTSVCPFSAADARASHRLSLRSSTGSNARDGGRASSCAGARVSIGGRMIAEEESRARHTMHINGDIIKLDEHCRGFELDPQHIASLPPSVAAALLRRLEEDANEAEIAELEKERSDQTTAKLTGKIEAKRGACERAEQKVHHLKECLEVKQQQHRRQLEQDRAARQQKDRERLEIARQRERIENELKRAIIEEEDLARKASKYVNAVV